MILKRCALLLLLLTGGCSGADKPRAPFNHFVSEYRSAQEHEREQTLNGFWNVASSQGLPLIERDSQGVIFLYRGPVNSVALTGDMTGWSTAIPMSRLENSDLFFVRQRFEREARLDYKFVLDGTQLVTDPMNPGESAGGYGVNSELAMPGFHRAPELADRTDISRGTILRKQHKSAILGYDHEIIVYLPSGYNGNAHHYPTVYFQDGEDYVRLGRAVRILDNLIADGSIVPVIGVFVVPPVEPERNRQTEYGMNERYVSFFTDELTGWIDSSFRTVAKPPSRLVVGDSYGGLISLLLAFRRPDVFGNAASQSGFVSFGEDRLIRLFRNAERKDIVLYADVGTYERGVGGDRSGEGDFLEANRRLVKVLQEKGYRHHYREFPDGHSWGRWKNELPDILRLFFPWK